MRSVMPNLCYDSQRVACVLFLIILDMRGVVFESASDYLAFIHAAIHLSDPLGSRIYE